MQQVVEIPGWLRKMPVLGKFMKPLGMAGKVSKNDQDIMLKIIQQFKDQSRKDIKQWREAVEACEHAENPRWYLLQDLYDYFEPDSQLGTAKDIRTAATLGKKYMVYDKNTGKEIPEKTKLLETEWFFNFVWNFLDTVFKGYTVAQLIDPETMTFSYVPRRNIIPLKNMVVFEVDGDKGVNYKEPPFDKAVISVVYKHNKGILNDIIPNMIWKKNARESWSEFAEKFGIPIITAETNKTNQKDLDKLEFMLKHLGEAATGIFPLGTKITIHDQATKGDPYEVFNKQIEIDNASISKRILGGTMLTDDGSSRSQGEVHERVHESLSMFDKMMITFLVNGALFKLMPGVFSENDAFKYDDSEKIGIKDEWAMTKDMIDLGFEIDIKWITDKFNIPVSGIPKRETPAQTNFKKATGELAATLVAKGVSLPVYKSTCGHYHTPIAASDGFTGNLLSELSDELINLVWEGKDTLINEVLKSITSHRHLLDGLLNSWSDRMLNITYDATDHHCLAAMEYNLFEFSRMKEKANVFALNELKSKAQNFIEFREEALPYLKNADINHLNTEWNHTFAVGQNASRYHQFMTEKDTLTRYVQWQTVGDMRVRPAHQVMDNKIFDLNDSSGLTVWPPKDWGCRCELVQYLGKPHKDLLISNDEGLKLLNIEKDSKWAVNRGRNEQVFTANEMYLKSQGLAKELNKLSYKDYKLEAYDTIKDKYSALNLDESITKKNAKELFKPEEGKNYMGFDDYLGRKMIMKKKVFDDHVTNDKYIAQKRHQMFAKVADVLKEPDEVYYSKFVNGKFQALYLKFYNDGAIVVPTQLGSKNVEINSWFSMDKEDFVRRGYLIHKKSRK